MGLENQLSAVPEFLAVMKGLALLYGLSTRTQRGSNAAYSSHISGAYN